MKTTRQVYLKTSKASFGADKKTEEEPTTVRSCCFRPCLQFTIAALTFIIQVLLVTFKWLIFKDKFSQIYWTIILIPSVFFAFYTAILYTVRSYSGNADQWRNACMCCNSCGCCVSPTGQWVFAIFCYGLGVDLVLLGLQLEFLFPWQFALPILVVFPIVPVISYFIYLCCRKRSNAKPKDYEELRRNNATKYTMVDDEQ